MKELVLEYLPIILAVLLLLFFIVFILLLVQMSKTNKLKKRLETFVLGKDGKSLEQDIISLYEDNKFLKNTTEKNKSVSKPYSRIWRVHTRRWVW